MIEHQHDQPKAPTRVVLLGARGFIGAAIRKDIEALGVPVVAPSSTELDLADARAADALAALIDPSDAVVMLSALTPDKGRDIATVMKNLSMMQNVCDAVARRGCAHFTYFSSDAVYDGAVSRVTDETPVSPRDLYGVMHYAREIMAGSLSKTPLLVLRPSIVYGIGDTHNSYGPNRFRRAARADGKITLFGGGEEMRDHVFVDDVAALTTRCLLHASTGTTTIGTGVSRSFSDVAHTVAAQFSNPIEIVTTPRGNPITYRHYDVTSLIKAFPDFRFVPVEEGIARVHQQMMSAG